MLTLNIQFSNAPFPNALFLSPGLKIQRNDEMCLKMYHKSALIPLVVAVDFDLCCFGVDVCTLNMLCCYHHHCRFFYPHHHLRTSLASHSKSIYPTSPFHLFPHQLHGGDVMMTMMHPPAHPPSPPRIFSPEFPFIIRFHRRQ